MLSAVALDDTVAAATGSLWSNWAKNQSVAGANMPQLHKEGSDTVTEVSTWKKSTNSNPGVHSVLCVLVQLERVNLLSV